jgi:hypothetical protein
VSREGLGGAAPRPRTENLQMIGARTPSRSADVNCGLWGEPNPALVVALATPRPPVWVSAPGN